MAKRFPSGHRYFLESDVQFEHLATERDCKITVVNQESLSPQREMVEDLMAIVHTFSCRLYGLRKYRKQLREEFRSAEPDKETESR